MPTREIYLHRNELGPSIFLGAELHHGEFIRPHRRRSNVTDLARENEVMKSAHGLFNWSVWIKSMNPEDINVIGF